MALSTNDLEWAKPFIDQARASVARGDVTTGEVLLAELRSRISSFKSA